MAKPYKRGEIYWGRVQRKGVEYRASLETTDFRTAQVRFKKWLTDLEGASWGERKRVTFAEAVRQFIMQHFPQLKPMSAARYALSLKWLSDSFDGKFLDEINRQSLSEFETVRRSGGVSSSTIRRDLACLSSLLTFCEDREWIKEGKNIVPAFLRRRSRRGLKEGKPLQRYLSRAEEALALATAAEVKCSKGPLVEAIMLAIDSGLREQEMFSLTWPQIDLMNNVIVTTRDTKNGKSRSVPIQERSARFLAQWKTANAASRVPSFYVFAKKNGKRYQNLYRGFKLLASKANIPNVCWHDLRRTAGCRWLQDHKKSIHEVSALLGHGSIAVTEKSYAFLDQLQVAKETAAQKQAHAQPELKLTVGKH